MWSVFPFLEKIRPKTWLFNISGFRLNFGWQSFLLNNQLRQKVGVFRKWQTKLVLDMSTNLKYFFGFIFKIVSEVGQFFLFRKKLDQKLVFFNIPRFRLNFWWLSFLLKNQLRQKVGVFRKRQTELVSNMSINIKYFDGFIF